MYQDSCYTAAFSWKTRDEASAACSGWGGHRLYIETNEELEYIHIPLPNGDYWIGLNVTRTYQWMDGTPALFDTFESSNGNHGNECFRMTRKGDFNWNDKGCSSSYGHICERRTMTSVVSGTFCCCF